MSSLSEKVLVTGAIAVVALVTIGVLRSANKASTASTAARSEHAASGENDEGDRPRGQAKDPRLVLGRPWFDKMPRKSTDVYDLWLFMGGGIGLEDKGSRYRSTLDLFELERQGSKLEIVWLQDKSKQAVKFEIVACSDKPPFDLCIDFAEPVRGQKRLYSWDDDADMDANVPWARAWRRSAEERARAAR